MTMANENTTGVEVNGTELFIGARGWVVHGERMTESGKVQHFRTPPEPHSYPEDIAKRMAEEMKGIHPSWVWSVVPPNAEVSDRHAHTPEIKQAANGGSLEPVVVCT